MDGGTSEENLMQQQDQQLQPRPPESRSAPQDHHHRALPPQRCPRCDSSNTKFCYYNNYSLSQPRYFCKACRRYWTQGGTLRNVPVGGGFRKSKRPRTDQGWSPATRPQNLVGMVSCQPSRPVPPVDPPMGGSFYTGGSFMSSLAAMHSFPAGGVNQGATVNLGGGSSHFGANIALLQGVGLPFLRSPGTPTTPCFPPHPSFIQPGPFGYCSQGLINTGGPPALPPPPILGAASPAAVTTRQVLHSLQINGLTGSGD